MRIYNLNRWGLAFFGLACRSAADTTPITPDGPRACNGMAQLCDLPLDQVTIPFTHNAMSSVEEGWLAPNQTFAVPRQLRDGIRGLSLDTHYFNGEAYLCHGYCELGSKPLIDGLEEIRWFLEDNPDEVVLLDFEDYVSTSDTVAAFEQSGLLARVYAHPPDTPWPTLAVLLDSGTPLVVFSDSGGEPAWYHATSDHVSATHWYSEVPDDFRCDPERGTPDGAFYSVNHFLTRPIALPELAEEVNYNPLFIDRMHQCEAETGRTPNFVWVDFYEVGDIFDVVSTLNGG